MSSLSLVRRHNRISAASPAIRRAAPLHGLAALAVLVLLARALIAAPAAPVTSDESLYLSEAVSIAQGRIEYASGDPIVHRAPLYPSTLAPLLRLSGYSVDATRAIPVLYALGALAALYALGRATFGARAAAAAVSLAAVASYPASLATAFFVDTPMTMWLLAAAALLASDRNQTRPSLHRYAVAGALLALAFLSKETAIAWLPLPLTLALLSAALRRRARPLAAFYATFAAGVSPWFAWVAVHEGALFKLDGGTVARAAAFAVVSMAGVAALAILHRRLRIAPSWCIAAAFAAAWCALMLYVLESRPEPQPAGYASSVPSWLWRVFASNVEPALLIAPAWLWTAYRAVRGDERARIVAAIALFALPLLLYVANRDWEVRQVMPLVYLSYLVLAAGALAALDRAAERWRAPQRSLAAAALIAALALVAGFATGLGPRDSAASVDWRTDDERQIAGWLASLPEGSSVLSSRQYYAQLFVDTRGRLPIAQLPTLGATIDERGLAPFGTMFRYADSGADLRAQRHWLHVRKYEGRPYVVALAEDDLLAEIRARDVTHILLTGDDAGFSSLAYRRYFESSAAFAVARSSPGGAVLFTVDRARLLPQRPPLVMSVNDLVYVVMRSGARSEDESFWTSLAPSGLLLDSAQLLDAADLASLARDIRADRAAPGG